MALPLFKLTSRSPDHPPAKTAILILFFIFFARTPVDTIYTFAYIHLMTIYKNSLALKKILFWIFVIAVGILSASIALLSLISIWIGIKFIHESGSWVPISSGTLLFASVCWLYSQSVRSFHYHIKKDAVFDI